MDTLGSIRQKIFDRLDWEPSGSPEAVRRINGFINDACKELAKRAPFGFAEKACRLQVDPDVESASADDTVAVLLATDYNPDEAPTEFEATGLIDNPWVLRSEHQRRVANGETVGDVVTMPADRSWDARTIILTHPAGHEIVNRIRTVWVESITPVEAPPVPHDEYRISLVHPMPSDLPAAGWSWKVVFDKVYLPQAILRLKSIRERGIFPELEVITTDQADEYGLTELEPGVVWDPRYDTLKRLAFRLPPETLEALANAPDVAELDGTTIPWRGPEAPGRFQYCLTLGWGKSNEVALNQGLAAFYDDQNDLQVSSFSAGVGADARAGRSRMRKLLLESAPSPESEIVTSDVTTFGETTTPAGAIRVTLPNIEYVLGFFGLNADGLGGTVVRRHIARSGLMVNIYRKRLTENRADTVGIDFEAAKVHKGEVREEYQFLAQVRIDSGNEGIFIDDGTYLPDRSKPLQTQGIHSTFGIYPKVKETKLFDVRYVCAPLDLANDSDPLPVTSAGREAILAYAKMLVCRGMLKDYVAASTYEATFERKVTELKRAKGTLKPRDQKLRRQRVRRRRR